MQLTPAQQAILNTCVRQMESGQKTPVNLYHQFPGGFADASVIVRYLALQMERWSHNRLIIRQIDPKLVEPNPGTIVVAVHELHAGLIKPGDDSIKLFWLAPHARGLGRTYWRGHDPVTQALREHGEDMRSVVRDHLRLLHAALVKAAKHCRNAEARATAEQILQPSLQRPPTLEHLALAAVVLGMNFDTLITSAYFD